MVTRRKTAGRRRTARRKTGGRWSARVTKHSNALDLEKSAFTSSDPHKIAQSLKRSAERSKRRKSTPYQSAMSMLNFYINRGGNGLSQRKVRVLERAKGELRKVFGRD
jgi:putative cell wall-binding protein